MEGRVLLPSYGRIWYMPLLLVARPFNQPYSLYSAPTGCVGERCCRLIATRSPFRPPRGCLRQGAGLIEASAPSCPYGNLMRYLPNPYTEEVRTVSRSSLGRKENRP